MTEIDDLDAPSENFLRGDADLNALRGGSDGATHSHAGVRLCAPIERPSNLVGISLNYAGHTEERGYDVPDEPIFFAKSPSSITDPDERIAYHDGVTNLRYEGEFGEEASDVDEDEAGIGDTVEVEGVGVLESQVTES
ncbi:fumarylacetoacetate hydrolase family protein [Halosolutus gelatinilyticus]|uniref:fumarylacetoacetate hydrolase family protein n=1 Tax=Halosolutus gelatinilyticus TaxID=2931975 RepID=UPI001FF3089F|nr:fumarylacetoacetate hydrolase family protein [Halosolutus gelatinilyticus]